MPAVYVRTIAKARLYMYNFRSKMFNGLLFRTFIPTHVDLMFWITWQQLEADQKAENHHTMRESLTSLDVSASSEARDHVCTVQSWRLNRIIMHKILHRHCVYNRK